MKISYSLLFLGLFLIGTTLVDGQMGTCTTDADCGSGKGVCINSFCSCKSGFGGATCDTRPDASCTFDAVSSTAGTFAATPTLTYSHPTLTIDVDASLQESSFLSPAIDDTPNSIPYSAETTILFGDGSHTDCNFPNGGDNGIAWNDDAAIEGSCVDHYSVNVPWTDAKSKCGFADIDGDRTYETTVTVSRKYVVETLRGQSVTRTDSSTHVLKIVFPTQVQVGTSNVQVTGAPSLLAVISFIDFNPENEQWTIKFRTSIQAPFKLVTPQIDSLTGLLNTEGRYLDSSLALSSISACNNNSLDCMQEGTLTFVKGSAGAACDALSGGLKAIFGLACQEGATESCPLIGGETATLTLNLATGNACPAVDSITFGTTTLAPFSDAQASIPRTSFITNQIAYFGAVITSTNAAISSRTVAPNSVCFQIGAGSCVPVEFTELSAANGKEPVFSVDLHSAANSAVFAALDNGEATAQFYQVRATIDVQFVGGTSKRSEISLFSGEVNNNNSNSNNNNNKRSVEFSRSVGLRSGINVELGSSDQIGEEGTNAGYQLVPSMIAIILSMIVSMYFFQQQ